MTLVNDAPSKMVSAVIGSNTGPAALEPDHRAGCLAGGDGAHDRRIDRFELGRIKSGLRLNRLG